MPLILPLTNGHLSNEDSYLVEGVSLLEEDYCIVHGCDKPCVIVTVTGAPAGI